jgi:response regulator RpfG family c-di-GMP phosphodiesterase
VADDVQGSSVLIVDDAAENLRLLAAVLKRGGLVPRPVTSGRLAIEAAVADPPDLVLLDVRMPEMSGVDVCRWFKQDERLRSIPVIFMSGLAGTDDKVEAFRVGAVDYVSKPFQDQEVLARVKTHLRLRRLQVELASHNLQLEQRIAEQVKVVTASQLAIIFALAKLAEARDDDTGQHIERVQTFSRMLAGQMREMRLHVAKLTTEFIDNLYQTASLHDIGKVGTPDAILLKPGKLTTEELAEMKVCRAMGRLLTRFGCRVRQATGGKEGLERVAQEAPDIILLDLAMPDMNGPQFLEELRKTHPVLPVVIVTGYPDSELMQQAMQYAPVMVLPKPMDQVLLERTIRVALGIGPTNEVGTSATHDTVKSISTRFTIARLTSEIGGSE